MRRSAALLVVTLAAACAQTASLPPPPGVRQIAVLPPVNRTGRDLVVAGEWWLERAMGQRRTTVPDVLAAETATLLARRGFQVVTPAPGVPALRFELLRWVPDASGIEFVVVAVRGELLAPDGQGTLWSASRTRWMVPVRGSPTGAMAYERAARTIAETFLAGWRAGS